MIRLDVDRYFRLPIVARRRVDAWLEEHGLLARRVTCVTLLDESGCRVKVECLDLDGLRPGADEIPRVVEEVSVGTPFPVEVLGEVRSRP